MSLATDSIFIAAISSNTDIMQRIGGRIYSTAIPLPDEDVDNVPVPYIIVTLDGLNNDQGTKDSLFESAYDTVQIGVEIAAENRTALAELAHMVRETVLAYMVEHRPLDDYQLTADAVQYDSMKPCFWQTIRYQCDVENDLYDE